MSQAPQTLEGWYALHDIRAFDWTSWKRLDPDEQKVIAEEAIEFFQRCERVEDADEGSSALYAVPGHKGDLFILHLRETVDELVNLELAFSQTRLADFTRPTYSFLSVTELSQYLAGDDSRENPQYQAHIARRLRPEIPPARYMSFYPMDKKRDVGENWYSLPMEERQNMMASHGQIGRSYRGQVQQMITGSIGFDDWEWGVTLYSDDPLPLKKIVHEMRFDEASAKYGLFGSFYIGLRLPAEELEEYLSGRLVLPTTK